MKRHYLTELIGTGEMDVDDYRTPLADYPTLNVQCEVPWDDARNAPLNTWVLAEVKAGDLTLFADDARIMALPDVPLDTPYDAISADQQEALRAALARWNIRVNQGYPETFGTILAAIRRRANGDMLDPANAHAEL